MAVQRCRLRSERACTTFWCFFERSTRASQRNSMRRSCIGAVTHLDKMGRLCEQPPAPRTRAFRQGARADAGHKLLAAGSPRSLRSLRRPSAAKFVRKAERSASGEYRSKVQAERLKFGMEWGESRR